MRVMFHAQTSAHLFCITRVVMHTTRCTMGGFVLTVSALCGFVCAITVGGFFRLLLLSEGAAGRMPVNLFALMSVCSKHGGPHFTSEPADRSSWWRFSSVWPFRASACNAIRGVVCISFAPRYVS